MSTTEEYVKMTPAQRVKAADAIYYEIRNFDEYIARWRVLQLVKEIEDLKGQVEWYKSELDYLAGEDD